jgi:Stage II sporulation protein E (SpoIIE)
VRKYISSSWFLALALLPVPAMRGESPEPPQPVVIIPQSNCVVHSGDNSAWSLADVDTSGWQPLSQFSPSGKDTVFWVRCTTSQNLAALADPSVQVLNVYIGSVWVNGRQAGAIDYRYGDATRRTNAGLTFALPAEIAGHVQSIAIRCILTRVGWVHEYKPAVVRLGNRESLIDYQVAEAHHFTDGLLPAYSLFLLVGASGLFLLGLYFHDRSQRPALWLALYCLAYGFFRIAAYIYSLAPFVPDGPLMLWTTLSAFGDWFAVLFFFSIAQRRLPRIYWIVFAAICYFVIGTNLPLILPAGWSLPVSLFAFKTLDLTQTVQSFAYTAPLVAFWPYNRLRGRRRTLFVVCLLWSATVLLFSYQGLLFHLRWTSPIQNFVALASLLIIAVLVVIIFRDQRGIAMQRARLSTEIESTRQLQNQLVPATLPTLPGINLDAAYLPAAEVGGDFYQAFPQRDGSTLVVIGDVSGKGLKAAMTGTLALGALRTLAQENLSPSQILSRLNSQLASSSDGGFTTCLCARMAPDGSLTLANAGHLAPYRNGEEVQLESGLPLGIASDAGYSESTLHLAPGDTLTFLSDGVVEAQSPTGELLGFDRTRAISTQSAEEIARAAQAHGQQDDITVLTLTFAPAEVVHA